MEPRVFIRNDIERNTAWGERMNEMYIGAKNKKMKESYSKNNSL